MRTVEVLPMLRELPPPKVERTPAREALRDCFAKCRVAEEAAAEFRKSLIDDAAKAKAVYDAAAKELFGDFSREGA